jgi:hypothetical protein
MQAISKAAMTVVVVGPGSRLTQITAEKILGSRPGKVLELSRPSPLAWSLAEM